MYDLGEGKGEIDKSDLYGSDKRYDSGPSYSVYYRPEWSTAFGMYVRGDILEQIGKTLMAGNSIRKTAKMVGVSKNTVKKFYKILIAIRFKSGQEDILCPCGDYVGHQGWCKHRYSQSPARQKFMVEWHKKNNKIYDAKK